MCRIRKDFFCEFHWYIEFFCQKLPDYPGKHISLINRTCVCIALPEITQHDFLGVYPMEMPV